MTNDIFRTVRELIQSNKCVLMGNAVNNEGELYDDSVENLTAILAMQDSYSEMLAALEAVTACLRGFHAADDFGPLDDEAIDAALDAIDKAKGN
jgi:hypothetical protein